MRTGRAGVKALSPLGQPSVDVPSVPPQGEMALRALPMSMPRSGQHAWGRDRATGFVFSRACRIRWGMVLSLLP
eukprot:11105745-Alexandrium_andersonii.AAC.1